MMCFLNVLRLHVSQSQRQKRLYKQYMDQLSGAYVERCTDLTPIYDPRAFDLALDPRGFDPLDPRYASPESLTWCDSETPSWDSGRCSSPCCSEVIFNAGQHFTGKGYNACRLPVCYPGNFG